MVHTSPARRNVAEATQRGREIPARIRGRSILQIYFLDTDASAESSIAVDIDE
jgi:hypothetical protein